MRLAAVAAAVLVTVSFANAQSGVPQLTLAADVSPREIDGSLKALNHDRTSGTPGERKGAEYLAAKLTEYGVRHTTYEVHAYLSWPRSASVMVEGKPDVRIDAIPPAFGGTTSSSGISADVLWQIGTLHPESRLGPEARGKVIVTTGIVSPDAVLRAQRAGAAAIVFVSENEILHEMIATTIWGTPTTGSARRVPTIPIVSIEHAAGEYLKPAPGQKPPRVTITTKVDSAWTDIPLVVADVPGSSPDFVLVATHLDAWYEGMTDTAGTVASILEMARVLQKQQARLRRGVRFAWWPGHSFGRYPGSAWYADRFWADLDEHGVAYTNLDGSGRRGSRMNEISASGWPGLADFSRSFAESVLKKTPVGAQADAGARGARVFRPGRDSDSSFQGIGIPEFAVGVPGPPRGHQDVEETGRISYWHTAQDTIEKIDIDALTLDTKYRVAQLYELATTPVLPHTIAPIVESYERAVAELASAAGPRFDLTTTRAAIARLETAAVRLDGSPRPEAEAAQAALNRLLVRVTHRLNGTLYSKSRFDQDPAAQVPLLPLLARARELPSLVTDRNTYGFLETELIRGRNEVEATLREAADTIEEYLKR